MFYDAKKVTSSFESLTEILYIVMKSTALLDSNYITHQTSKPLLYLDNRPDCSYCILF